MSSDVSPSDHLSSGRAADPDRLRALARYDILDTPPAETFDRISDLAAGLFDAPIGLITFVEADRQWHKACVGFDVPELDLDTSFCVHALGDGQQLVVEDATDDERFVDNPLVTGEFRLIDGQGRTRCIDTLVIPVREGDGTTHILATGEDITERKEREQELRLKERAMDEATVGIQITDATRDDNPLVYVNEGFEDMTGYDRDEVLGRNPRFLQGPGTDPDTVQTLRSAINAEEPVTVEIQNYRKDGTPYWERLSVTPVRDEDGTLQNYIGIQQDITERRRRTQSLEDRQRKLDLVLSGTETGIAEWALQTDEVRWDETLQGVLGHAPETFEEFGELVHPNDLNRVEEALETMIETGDPWYGEFRMETGAGDFAWLASRMTPVYESDMPVKVFATATDITERKEQERRLRMLSEAVEQATESVLITEGGLLEDAGLEIEYVNEAYEEMTGWAEEEILGETPRVLQGPETDREVLDSLRAALEAGEEWQGETINDKKDGEPYRVQWNVSPVIGTDGEIEQWVSVQRDVTEEREREQALAESEERYQTLLQAAPDPVFVAEADTGTIIETNAAAEALIGRDRDDIVGSHQSALHPDDHADAYRRMFKKSAADEGMTTTLPDGQQPQVLTADGETVPVEINSRTVHLPDGPVIYGVFRDLSVRKAMQAELTRRERRFRMMFEQHSAPMLLIDEDTGDIRDANEAALEFYGYSADTLTSTSIDEINQLPADAVDQERRAAAEGGGEEADPDDTAAHFASLIEKGGQRLMDTLDSVLNLSKLEGGDHTLVEEPVDLSAEAQSVVDELQPAADEKDLALRVDAGEDSVQAQADAGGVQLVARNLLKNAIKYTEAGGTVEVRVRDKGDAVTLAVEDNGIGLGEEALAHIFDPFRQESEGLGREYEGVGLGLAIVEQATQQMDGSIEVNTEQGEGSRFTVRLPTAVADSP